MNARKSLHAKVTPMRVRPPVSLGAFIRHLLAERGIDHASVAEKAGLRRAQMSKLVNGGSVLAEQYEAVAVALGFKNALEMFQAHDVSMRRILRYWPLLDDKARKDVLRLVRAKIEATED
jgi:transcriptional regulator with XRE-family HTH domain